MLKRKLYTAGFILSSFVSVAVASGSWSNNRPLINSPVIHKAGTHQFDSSGLCTCIPIDLAIEPSKAPRITLNKNVAAFVKDYNKKNGFFLDKAKLKIDHYFAIIDSIFCLYEIPAELKYLAFIESGLKRNVISRSGAIGPWALMPVVAKDYGLKISKHNDERLDYYKSTHAAARLLKDLYAKFGDWLLVIAAYNSGPGWIQKGIQYSGTRNIWAMQQFLPKETQKHVRRFIAVHYHFEGHGSLVTMTKAETESHIKAVAAFTAQQQVPIAIGMQKADSLSVVIVK